MECAADAGMVKLALPSESVGAAVCALPLRHARPQRSHSTVSPLSLQKSLRGWVGQSATVPLHRVTMVVGRSTTMLRLGSSIRLTHAERARLQKQIDAQRARGLAAEMLDGQAARAVESELAPDVEAAAYFKDEAQVDPPQLLRALSAAIARTPSITTKSGSTVASILQEGGRAVGVALEGGEKLMADAVILAAGSWSSLVPGVPKEMPRVEPVRGQLVMLEERPPRLKTIVFGAGGYIVPRGDGRVVCGSTMENVGHRREITAEGIHSILSATLAIAPGLKTAELSKTWCNFRPHAKGGPLIGKSSLPGLFLATGHHRNGILLAKVTAVAVAEAVLGSH